MLENFIFIGLEKKFLYANQITHTPPPRPLKIVDP